MSNPMSEMMKAFSAHGCTSQVDATARDLKDAFPLRPAADYVSIPNTGEKMQPQLKVWLTSFPESNGKRNWTAMIKRVEPFKGLIGNNGGITIARGEYWNRVAYEAERARFLLGERDTEPHILDYGDDIKTPEEWKGETRGG